MHHITFFHLIYPLNVEKKEVIFNPKIVGNKIRTILQAPDWKELSISTILQYVHLKSQTIYRISGILMYATFSHFSILIISLQKWTIAAEKLTAQYTRSLWLLEKYEFLAPFSYSMFPSWRPNMWPILTSLLTGIGKTFYIICTQLENNIWTKKSNHILKYFSSAKICNSSSQVDPQNVCNIVDNGTTGSCETVSIKMSTNIGRDGGSSPFKIIVCKNGRQIKTCVSATNNDKRVAVYDYDQRNKWCGHYDLQTI